MPSKFLRTYWRRQEESRELESVPENSHIRAHSKAAKGETATSCRIRVWEWETVRADSVTSTASQSSVTQNSLQGPGSYIPKCPRRLVAAALLQAPNLWWGMEGPWLNLYESQWQTLLLQRIPSYQAQVCLQCGKTTTILLGKMYGLRGQLVTMCVMGQ